MSWLFSSGTSTPAAPSTPNPDDAHNAEKESPVGSGPAGRVLRVRVGPSFATLDTVNVNDDAAPQFIDSPHFVGHVAVRVKNFRGVTPEGTPALSDTPYFASLSFFNFVDKHKVSNSTPLQPTLLQILTHPHPIPSQKQQEYSTDDVVFGAEFEHKVNPPTGAWLAMKFANMIDPALLADLYAEKPWLYSPILCSMNIANVVKAPKTPFVGAAKELKATDPPLYKSPSASETSTSLAKALASGSGVANNPKDVVGEWTWGGEKELVEDNELLLPEYVDEPRFPCNGVAERRRYFGNKTHREEASFSPDYVYNLE
ncbi:hypothetical protein HDU99_000460, partial [Rhizoclosmatium hyalinum]